MSLQVRARWAQRGLDVDLELPPSMPTVRADPDRLMQVVMNLLSNAAKFARARVTVALDAVPEDSALIIDGLGLPERGGQGGY